MLTREDLESIDRIEDVAHLEELLSAPSEEVVNALAKLDGDLLILGVAGKMGPSLARMARRAFDELGRKRRVIGVARFSSPELRTWLDQRGVETIACDLLDAAAIARLPDAPNVVYMVGRKFGSAGQESLTWAVNAIAPAFVAERYRESRIVAFSTGNVYAMTPTDSGGSRETEAPGPIGEYAMSCLGRERVFEHISRRYNVPMAIIRLNYASEMRYGVLVDIARAIQAKRAVDVSTGYFNTIWQADANAQALRLFAHASSPPFVINVSGPETLRVRDVSAQIGEYIKMPVQYTGSESQTALLSNTAKAQALFGAPTVSAERLIRWTADWIARGGQTHRKPTHFQVRDGRF